MQSLLAAQERVRCVGCKSCKNDDRDWATPVVWRAIFLGDHAIRLGCSGATS